MHAALGWPQEDNPRDYVSSHESKASEAAADVGFDPWPLGAFGERLLHRMGLAPLLVQVGSAHTCGKCSLHGPARKNGAYAARGSGNERMLRALTAGHVWRVAAWLRQTDTVADAGGRRTGALRLCLVCSRKGSLQ